MAFRELYREKIKELEIQKSIEDDRDLEVREPIHLDFSNIILELNRIHKEKLRQIQESIENVKLECEHECIREFESLISVSYEEALNNPIEYLIKDGVILELDYPYFLEKKSHHRDLIGKIWYTDKNPHHELLEWLKDQGQLLINHLDGSIEKQISSFRLDQADDEAIKDDSSILKLEIEFWYWKVAYIDIIR